MQIPVHLVFRLITYQKFKFFYLSCFFDDNWIIFYLVLNIVLIIETEIHILKPNYPLELIFDNSNFLYIINSLFLSLSLLKQNAYVV